MAMITTEFTSLRTSVTLLVAPTRLHPALFCAASVFLQLYRKTAVHISFSIHLLQVFVRRSGVVWRSGSVLISVTEVNRRRARLVLGWVTVSGFNFRCRTFISVCNQPPRPTQPSILPESVNEDQLRLGRKMQVWFIPIAGKYLRYKYTYRRYKNSI